ncbi:acyl carrier protein [Streptomyces syringium]|uniref:acyl carrier protein n=1 Tax=Streptomyces syringium TaxID=76729 RepID=UPI0033B57D28
MAELIQQSLDFIRDYLARECQVPPGELAEERTFDSLGLDSIAQVEMFVTLSDHYGVDLDHSLASSSTTLLQTAALVQTALDHGEEQPRSGTSAVRG